MSVTQPRGFRAAAARAGLKSAGDDVALVVNEGPSDTAAAVFTANRVKAAPVQWSQQVLRTGRARAVVLNSGGANACTGPDGFLDTHRTAEHTASVLGLGAIDIVVCSTGLIGDRLDLDLLLPGVTAAGAALHAAGGPAAARAIMTTDSVPKQAVHDVGGWSVGGMAKGAGMLAPALATMLVVLTTDAMVEPEVADAALRAATATTFDRLDSDGCMSTNDTVVLLASGASGVAVDLEGLVAALTAVSDSLARQLMADAEGASNEVSIRVVGAATVEDAVEVARAVARSNLLKCALHGNDPNWGRVLSAVGTTTAAFDPDDLAVTINGVGVCRNGAAAADRSLVDLSGRAVLIEIGLAAGVQSATVLTNDLTAAYVHENSAYST